VVLAPSPRVLGQFHAHCSGRVESFVEGSSPIHDSAGVGFGSHVRQGCRPIHSVVLLAPVTLLSQATVVAADNAADDSHHWDQDRPRHSAPFCQPTLMTRASHMGSRLVVVHDFEGVARLHSPFVIGGAHGTADARVDDAVHLQVLVRVDGSPDGSPGSSRHLRTCAYTRGCVCMCVRMYVRMCVCMLYCFVCMCAVVCSGCVGMLVCELLFMCMSRSVG
jgi:hypothetical protein